MTNILYIGKYNGIVGGIERYMQKSAELLRRNSFAVHYLYTENGGKEPESFADAFDTVQIFSPENNWLKNADMVIIHNIIGVEYLPFMPKKKTFFFAHDHNIYCQRHHYYFPVGRINCHRKYNKIICKICSLCRNAPPPLAEYRKFPALVLSDFMAENLHRNGFETVLKLPAFIKTEKKEHKFMPDKILRVLFLGQLIRGKGADLMLETLAKLDIAFSCIVAGDGNDRKMLEKMVEKYHLGDKVYFTGFVSEPEKLWQNCDVFFFPIRWQEPFGLVALEAMAHGVPAVAFELGGVREYLSENCGILIPEKDTGKAAEALTELYAHQEKLEELGRNALQVVEEKFTEKEFVEKIKGLCEVQE